MKRIAITAASILALASAPAFALGLAGAMGAGGGSGSTSAFATSGGGSMSMAGMNGWSNSGSSQFAGAASTVTGNLTPSATGFGATLTVANTSEAATEGSTYANSAGLGMSGALGGAEAQASGGYFGGGGFTWGTFLP